MPSTLIAAKAMKFSACEFCGFGHTQGSVVYYVPELETVICGDLIFYHSIGRTDLYSSSPSALVESIRTKIFTLPSQTRLIPGHGPLTSVAEEIANNPYVDLVG